MRRLRPGDDRSPTDVIPVMITLHITTVLAKKYITSDESIENLLYYKDCQRKTRNLQETSTEKPTLLRRGDISAPRQPDCPFPKMCCSLSCGDNCGGPKSFANRQLDSMSNLQQFQPTPVRQLQAPIQPPVHQRGRKKKGKFPPEMQLPITRRDFGFTKEKIKSLISQDDDIRKILKDLVRVTMKKVDLLDMLTTEKVESVTQVEAINDSEDDDYYE